MDANTIDLLKCFFNQLVKPICLVAHNGNGFDYPILKEHLKKLVCRNLKSHVGKILTENFFFCFRVVRLMKTFFVLIHGQFSNKTIRIQWQLIQQLMSFSIRI